MAVGRNSRNRIFVTVNLRGLVASGCLRQLDIGFLFWRRQKEVLTGKCASETKASTARWYSSTPTSPTSPHPSRTQTTGGGSTSSAWHQRHQRAENNNSSNQHTSYKHSGQFREKHVTLLRAVAAVPHGMTQGLRTAGEKPVGPWTTPTVLVEGRVHPP